MNLLFHHLQKSGGTSIRFWVARALGAGMLEFGPKSRSGTLPEHVYRDRPVTIPTSTGNPLRAIMGHYVSFPVVKRLGWDPETVISATIIRDPAERLFSQYMNYDRQEPGAMPSFEEWLAQTPIHGRNMPRICYCLQCQFEGFRHRVEPMSHFYASRMAGEFWRGLSTVAERALRGMRVYTIGEIPILVKELADSLDLDPTDYHPEYVSGFGEQVTEQHRQLVAKNHPLDAELYRWARKLKKKRQPLGVTG